ncbi:MAG: NAD(P)-dependent oxidoreductase [Candidatus Micrarchaeia archaeon]
MARKGTPKKQASAVSKAHAKLRAATATAKEAAQAKAAAKPHTIAVSGAAGRLGKLLVTALLQKGYHVIAIVRDDLAEWELRKHACNRVSESFCKAHPALFIVKDQLDNSDALAQKIAGATDFVHLAAKIDYSATLDEMIRANVAPTKVAAEACRKADARLIFISSTSVTRKDSATPINEEAAANPINNYGKSKSLAEDAVRQSTAAYVICRFPIIYGEGFTEGFSKVLSMAKSGKLQIIGTGNNKISFINASDAISAIEAVIANPLVRSGTFYFSGKAHTQKETYEIVAHALGVVAPARHVSKEFAIRALQLRNAALTLLGKKPPMTVENILTLADSREYDCRKARETFGWEPKVRLSKESLGPYL